MKSIDRKYLNTFAVCCLFILAIGLNNAYSIFIVPLADTFECGRGTITLASTITDLICSTLSPVLVILLRKVSLNRLLLLSTSAYSLLMMAIGVFPNIYIYYLINILKGFVFVVYGVNIIIIVLGYWFEKYRETLIGTAVAFTGVGGALFSQIFSFTLNSYGLKFTFILFGVLNFVLALPAIMFLKLKPEELGLTVLKADAVRKENLTTSKLREFKLKDPVFIGICIIYFVLVFLTNVSIHFPGYAESIGYSAATGASMVSFMMIGSILFKTGMGVVCDRFGPKSGFPVTISIVFFSMLLIVFARNEAMLFAGSFIFGGIFSTTIILSPFIRYCFGNGQYPDVFSKVMVVSALSNMGGPIIGYIYDFTGSYVSSLYAASFLCIIAFICYLFTIKITDRS